ncbi:unnamed protein product [Camellia sinensis]
MYLGSLRMGPTHPHYLQALELGKEWAGPGLMDAATKGVLQAGKPIGGFKISKEAGKWTATNFHPYLPSETYLTCSINVVTQQGFVLVDERMQVPHLYCIGDANGKMMLAYAASAQGISVVEQVSGKDHVLKHLSIPAACFTHPEISMVGLTETSFKANTKVVAENEGEGLVKLHIEQGSVLESIGLPLGVVKGIAGQTQIKTETIEGHGKQHGDRFRMTVNDGWGFLLDFYFSSSSFFPLI